jgi:hypothetical protein
MSDTGNNLRENELIECNRMYWNTCQTPDTHMPMIRSVGAKEYIEY